MTSRNAFVIHQRRSILGSSGEMLIQRVTAAEAVNNAGCKGQGPGDRRRNFERSTDAPTFTTVLELQRQQMR